MEYLHCSMAGSYWIDCTVVEEQNGSILIEYYDLMLEETVKEWVHDPQDYLRG